MQDAVTEYHRKRIPFIIIPRVALIVGDKDGEHSHSELLLQLGIDESAVRNIIDNYPRGYFLNNRLVIYQGDNIKEGESWYLDERNYNEVARFYPELKRIFAIGADTRVFLGVLRGKPGTVWDVINEVDLTFFDRQQ